MGFELYQILQLNDKEKKRGVGTQGYTHNRDCLGQLEDFQLPFMHA